MLPDMIFRVDFHASPGTIVQLGLGSTYYPVKRRHSQLAALLDQPQPLGCNHVAPVSLSPRSLLYCVSDIL